MGFDPATIAIIGLGVSAFGVYQQYEGAQEAAAARRQQAGALREQAALEQKKADILNVRQLRSSVRQARLARASVINTGALSGTSGSSGVLGGVGSIQSQEASNIGFFNQLQDINKDVYGTQERIAGASVALGEAGVTQAAGGALGSLGGTIFSDADGFKTIFKS